MLDTTEQLSHISRVSKVPRMAPQYEPSYVGGGGKQSRSSDLCIPFPNLFIYFWLCWVAPAQVGATLLLGSLGFRVLGLQELQFLGSRAQAQ